ncbi:hypothetical protein [Acinetobacter tandoii]
MNLEQTTEMYASVLRQLLPIGGYDRALGTNVAKDIYAHAKALAKADIDAKRLLKVIEGIPSDLVNEYEHEYGLPLKCTVNSSLSIEERLRRVNWVRNLTNVLNKTYLEQLLSLFGVELIDLQKYTPLQCTAPCNSAVNTEQLRYKVTLKLESSSNADMACIIKNYLPAYLRIDYLEI